jgi:ubiquinone/menaquinone biosynthesis C-methylase UbiE
MRGMMQRELEPELMDGGEQAQAYAVADFAEVNQGFVDRFRALYPKITRGRIADLGCGPADIPIRLCRALPEVLVTAVDGANAMLEHARQEVEKGRLEDRIELLLGFIPGALGERRGFDAIISNSLLHHLPDPSVLWREIIRAGRVGAAVLIMDLMRPASKDAARAIVETYAQGERQILKTDFFNSLCAAFTVDEVEEQLRRAGLDGRLRVERASDRHLLVTGTL